MMASFRSDFYFFRALSYLAHIFLQLAMASELRRPLFSQEALQALCSGLEQDRTASKLMAIKIFILTPYRHSLVEESTKTNTIRLSKKRRSFYSKSCFLIS